MIALDVLYLKIYHMYLAKMYIETAIPKNVYVPVSRTGHHTVSKPAQSVFIMKTSFVVQMIALDVLYPNIHHMYLVEMYIETIIPKNVYVTHRAPHSTKASTISFHY